MKNSHANPTYAHYLAIWAWLIALLIAGTFVSGLPLAHQTAVLIILSISLIKAVLVALFYMHLKFERAIPLWVVAIFPFFLIGMATFLVFIGTALS